MEPSDRVLTRLHCRRYPSLRTGLARNSTPLAQLTWNLSQISTADAQTLSTVGELHLQLRACIMAYSAEELPSAPAAPSDETTLTLTIAPSQSQLQISDDQLAAPKQDALQKGWDLLSCSEDKVKGDIACQSIAAQAGMLHAFFAAFLDFAQAAVKMPDSEKQKEMDSVSEDAKDAYKNAFMYSIEYAKAISCLGMLPNKLQLCGVALEMEVDDGEEGEPLSEADIEKSLDLATLEVSVKLLSGAAKEQVGKGMDILGKAMAMQAQGNQWAAAMKNEADARERLESATKAKEQVQFGKALREAQVMTEVLSAQKEELVQQQAAIKKK
jgi:hypothetical protein